MSVCFDFSLLPRNSKISRNAKLEILQKQSFFVNLRFFDLGDCVSVRLRRMEPLFLIDFLWIVEDCLNNIIFIMFRNFSVFTLVILQLLSWSNGQIFSAKPSPKDRALEMLKQMNLTEKLIMM